MVFEHYITAGGKKLRCGYTTGTCAALAASAAAGFLLSGKWSDTVSLVTPKGIRVEVETVDRSCENGRAECAVIKDGGDDIDATSGIKIFAAVSLTSNKEITIDGGEGVGRVTKPGLNQPVGAAAINSVPRQMIEKSVREQLDKFDYHGGAEVIIHVPEGRATAQKTFNPHLGIEGGISIIGTSGIVEPMSNQAIIDTMKIELKQARELGNDRLIIVPGNYGLDFLKGSDIYSEELPVVRCSNFIGEAIDEISLLGFGEAVIVGHIGKLVKLSGGIMNTHSKQADCRAELFTAHAAVCGASREVCMKLMDSATTDSSIEILKEADIFNEVMYSLSEAIQRNLDRRSTVTETGAVVFSNVYGELFRTEKAKEIISGWQEHSTQ